MPALLKGLMEDGWCIVFTVRNVFAGDLMNLLKTEIPKFKINKAEVSLLTDKAIKDLARAYRIALPQDQTLLDRIKNLFYLSLYTQYYQEIDMQSSDSAFLKLVWDKKYEERTIALGISEKTSSRHSFLKGWKRVLFSCHQKNTPVLSSIS